MGNRPQGKKERNYISILLLRGSDQWHWSSLLGERFREVAIWRKFVFLSSSSWIKTMWFSVVLYWRVVDNIYLWYCIECLFVSHEGTDTLDEVTEMDADITQEGISIPSSYDNDCLLLEIFPRKILTKGIGLIHICVKIPASLYQSIVYLTSGIGFPSER